MNDEFAGVYHHKGVKYVSKTNFKRKCNLVEDIASHPVLNALATMLATVMAILLCCLIYTCCQYSRVSEQYELIK